MGGNSPVQGRRGGNAFTLIELLVVIAIIAVLASLILPGLSRAKAQAKSAVCKSNLRQASIAFAMYLDDNRSTYPPYLLQQVSLSGAYLAPSIYWTDQLLPFGIKKSMPKGISSSAFGQGFLHGWGCPASKVSGKLAYGYNFGGLQTRDPYTKWPPTPLLAIGMGNFIRTDFPGMAEVYTITVSKIVSPAQMIEVGDVGAGKSDNLYEQAMLSRNPGISLPDELPGSTHMKGANMLFCDGHVAYAKKVKWLADDSDTLRQWNNDNLPHRELLRPLYADDYQ